MCGSIRTLLRPSLLILFSLSVVYSQESETCYLRNGSFGICKHISNCISAQKELKKQIRPISCGFDGNQPIVCCEKNEKITEDRISTRISEEKCLDYLKLDIKTTITTTTTDKPGHAISGGVNVYFDEYPHMAILGYGKGEQIEFKCGGSLISEQFVLTAAHCLESKDFGNVSLVRLGDRDIASTTEFSEPQNFKILKTYPHPDYDFISFYNDIAVIKLDRPAIYTRYVKPACLQSQTKLEHNNLTITGWGAMEYGGNVHSYLQTADLMNLPSSNCIKSYRPHIRLEKGFQEESQICGGNLEKTNVDACQGDSGGPLQAKIQRLPQMYRIVGVTSFGNNCGLVPGVYTRVSKYISWIESIVWPNQ